MIKETTPFSAVYDDFLSKITDDMYMELTQRQTYSMLQELLMAAIHKFQFPRVDINDFDKTYVDEQQKYQGIESGGEEVKTIIYYEGRFNTKLTLEQINILSTYMIVEWMGQQLATIDLIRMKYSGDDFKFTSQANHMQKLLQLKKDYERQGFHLQRLYKRRAKDGNGIQRSTFDTIMYSPRHREYWQ